MLNNFSKSIIRRVINYYGNNGSVTFSLIGDTTNNIKYHNEIIEFIENITDYKISKLDSKYNEITDVTLYSYNMEHNYEYNYDEITNEIISFNDLISDLVSNNLILEYNNVYINILTGNIISHKLENIGEVKHINTILQSYPNIKLVGNTLLYVVPISGSYESDV